MKKEFLETGRIVNTHGVKGEVKVVPWADSPEFLCGFDTLYLDDTPVKVEGAKVHKGNVLLKLEGVDDVEGAMKLRNRVLSIRRADARLPQGSYFLADLIGLEVLDEDGNRLGTLKEVLSPSSQQVYVVEGEREIMIPAVPEFVLEKNVQAGYIRVRLIEGL